MDEPTGGPPRRIYQRLDKTAGYPYSLGEYARRFVWQWVQATLVRFSPMPCGIVRQCRNLAQTRA